jgi:hypothetical protein
MGAIVNLVLAASVSAVFVYSWLPPVIDETESTSIWNTMAVDAACTKIKCHGDFPVSHTRRYAEVKQQAWNETARI